MSDDKRVTAPIWHSPAWIAAIVGLVSAFLTIPEIVGNYLSKQQDIRLAEEQTAALQISNIDAKQDQEFKIVNSTLAQQGTERVFVLRYLAATLDQADARQWAAAEVKRLDDLASRQEQLDRTRRDFAEKEEALRSQIEENSTNAGDLRDELDRLRSDLDKKNSEVQELTRKAGLQAGKVFTKGGNNGTATCDTFCAGSQWPGGVGTCVGAKIVEGPGTGEFLSCRDTRPPQPKLHVHCLCTRF